MAIYFSGYQGYFTITGFEEKFTINAWTYTEDRSNVDITNFRAKDGSNIGGEQYIANIYTGVITADGFLTEELYEIFNNADVQGGLECKISLYFNYDEDIPLNNLGFEDLECIIDNIVFNMDIQSTATFTLTANLSVPVI